MAMGDIPAIRNDLPMAMTMAAFVGISWYIGVEINTSLFLLFKRRRGLYFWSCALSSWGVVLQPLFIILADFGIWTNLKISVTMIYLTWLIMVVPQSWVLYSRLYLVMPQKERILIWVKVVLIFNSIIFSVPTIIIGTLSQTTSISPHLSYVNTIWDRLQLTVFFTQETLLSILYIHQTRERLRSWSMLHIPSHFEPESKLILRHLVYTNILVIVLDVTLLGIEYTNMFYLQGSFKPCVYGIKLKVEFIILNCLIESMRVWGGGLGHRAGSGNE